MIKETSDGIEYRITGNGIEFGMDTVFDSEYSGSCAVELSAEELEVLLKLCKKDKQ